MPHIAILVRLIQRRPHAHPRMPSSSPIGQLLPPPPASQRSTPCPEALFGGGCKPSLAGKKSSPVLPPSSSQQAHQEKLFLEDLEGSRWAEGNTCGTNHVFAHLWRKQGPPWKDFLGRAEYRIPASLMLIFSCLFPSVLIKPIAMCMIFLPPTFTHRKYIIL